MLYEELSGSILKAYFNVLNVLGTGYLESVYENAVLIVPKGWKQKKAAKIGSAWGKFKNIKHVLQ